jgi:glycosyltransferase involved in cell wall biosynthesis
MSRPLVSVCLPNRNTFPYLPERVETIFDQTCKDWELVVSDNFSDDGAWEFFEGLASKDRRVSVEQAPREGMYANWNNCIRRARGKYIYIATSDDTMAPDCLEKLVAVLERYSECDLAHCRLQAEGESAGAINGWWQDRSLFARSSGGLMECLHIRLAPFDGLLHLYGEPVYTSITQLLIRRSLFERIGLFEPKWGSIGDFHWGMRVSLVANTIHVPDTWGGWRQHPAQATYHAGLGTDEHRQKIEEMIVDALTRSGQVLSEQVLSQLRRGWRARFRSRSEFLGELDRLRNRRERVNYLLKQMLKLSGDAWAFALSNLGLYKSREENFIIPLSEWMMNGNTRRSSHQAVQDACGAWFMKKTWS